LKKINRKMFKEGEKELEQWKRKRKMRKKNVEEIPE
jgi:hypothetical protein